MDERSTLPDTAIDIALPADVARASTLRVIVAALGADAGFSVDEIDDLRLAVSEIFNVLADVDDDSPQARVHARFVPDGRTVVVEMSRGGDGADVVLDPLATTILASVVDEHSVDRDRVTLVKHGRETLA